MNPLESRRLRLLRLVSRKWHFTDWDTGAVIKVRKIQGISSASDMYCTARLHDMWFSGLSRDATSCLNKQSKYLRCLKWPTTLSSRVASSITHSNEHASQSLEVISFYFHKQKPLVRSSSVSPWSSGICVTLETESNHRYLEIVTISRSPTRHCLVFSAHLHCKRSRLRLGS